MSELSRSELTRPGSACEAFDQDVAELALGLLDGAERDRLLAHASTCARCRTELDSLTLVGDRLTLLAPSAEPPAGFESVAVAAMGSARAGSRPPGSQPPVARSLVAIAAAVVLVALGIGLLFGHGFSRGDSRVAALDRAGVTTVRSGTFIDGSGRSTGTVLATGGQRTLLVMTLAVAEPGSSYRCEVALADGSRHVVGTWVPAADQPAWSVTLPSALDAGSVRSVTLRDADAAHSSTAQLSPG